MHHGIELQAIVEYNRIVTNIDCISSPYFVVQNKHMIEFITTMGNNYEMFYRIPGSFYDRTTSN